MKKKLNRRDFLTRSAALGVAGVVAPAIFTSCGNQKQAPLREPGTYYVPGLEDKADAGRELKVGLVGCGGRGTGALSDLLNAADGIVVAAYGDVFQDRMDECRNKIKEKFGQEVPDEKCFLGFDAYMKVIDSGIDMVILTTPPVFRPEMFEYAVQKGVHAFLEKPISVDPKGYRRIIAAARQAEAKGLSVVTGTQRHHQRCYVEAFKKIQEGMIGEITSGNVYWNQGMLWYRNRKKEWSDTEWMIRDWVNWSWLSGDHIVEQHVHNIDVFMWMSGLKPVSARGFGARHRRITGDQYDQFSIDFEFENGIHLHSMCQQIDGTSGLVKEVVHGTKGWWDSAEAAIFANDGTELWRFDKEAEKAEHPQTNPYVLEHVDWVNHIRRGETHDEATATAQSSLAGAMGREAAYTGQVIKWDEFSASELDMLPENLKLGPMDMTAYKVKTPGAAKE